MTSILRKFTKYTSISLLVSGSFAAASCGDSSGVNGETFAGDVGGILSYERCPYSKSKFFTLTGNVGSFTKAGFSGGKIDLNKNYFPTESFTSMFGELTGKFNINEAWENDVFAKFEVGLGVAATGLAYDSTKNDGGTRNKSGLSSGSGINTNYIGYYGGYSGNGEDGYKDARLIMVHNAYVDMQTNALQTGRLESYFDLKLGRYESSMDYFSGFTQGVNFDWHFQYGNTDARPDNEVKLWWFSSFGRAFAYSQWFYDYYSVKAVNGVDVGIHALGADVTYGGVADDENGFAYGDKIFARPFFYFAPGLYEAPGLKLVYDYQFGNGMGVNVTAQGYVLHVHKAFTTTDKNSNLARYNEAVDEWSQNINLIAQGNIYNYNVRVGYYENFGSAGSHFGTYGNPMGIDFWTGSVYDIGASISDIINRNARSGYLSGGGYYDLRYGTLSWDLLGRITRSPRSNEESIALYVNHDFKNGLVVGLKIEWFRDTTHAGYTIGSEIVRNNNNNNKALSSSITNDRSHAFFTVDYNF